MNSIYALTEKAKRNKISMESYINLFKEYVRKAGIVTDEVEPNNAAVSLFCQGLPFKVLQSNESEPHQSNRMVRHGTMSHQCS
jgi:hypothetical protein